MRDARRTQGGVTGAVVLPLPAEAVLVGTAYAGHESPQAEVEQLRYRCAGTKAVEHAGQREIQHKSVEPRYRSLRQKATAGSDITAKHERKKGKGDEKNA